MPTDARVTGDLHGDRPGEWRVRVLAAGLCHSDLSVITAIDRGRTAHPRAF